MSYAKKNGGDHVVRGFFFWLLLLSFWLLLLSLLLNAYLIGRGF